MWIPTAETEQVGLKLWLCACILETRSSNIPRGTCNADWGVSSYSRVPINEFWDSTSIMWRLLPFKSFPKSSFISRRFVWLHVVQLLTWVSVTHEKESSQSNSCQQNLFYKSTFCWKDSNFCSCWIKMWISRTHLPRISNTITDRTSNNNRTTLFPQMFFQPCYFCDIPHSITIETTYRFHPYQKR